MGRLTGSQFVRTSLSIGSRRVWLVALVSLSAVTFVPPAGAISFVSTPFIPTGESPFSLAAGDFNEDGKTDLAVVALGSDEILIFRGDGHGGLTLAETYPVGSTLLWSPTELGDFDNDGHLDVVVRDHLLLGDGNGRFTVTSWFLPEAARAIAPVDLDADGRLDLIVAADFHTFTLRGDGAGAFHAAVEGPSHGTQGIVAIAAGDVNGDGFPDAAIGTAVGVVSILLGDGRGGLSRTADYAFGGAFVLQDLNADAKLDLAVAARSQERMVVSLGDGFGNFGPPHDYPGMSANAVVAGDFDGDGHVDLAAAGGFDVALLLGDGSGAFSPAQFFAAGSGASDLAIADLDADGLADVAVANLNHGTVSVFLGESDGTLRGARTAITAGIPRYAASADLDGDGNGDLVVATPESNLATVLLGNDKGGLAPVGNFLCHPGPLVLADFNGDAKPDVASISYDFSTVWVFLGDGNGHFGAPVDYSVDRNPTAIAAADLNGDARIDLVVRTHAGPSDIAIFLGDGAGGFSPGPAGPPNTGGWELDVADLNADDRPDVVLVQNDLSQTGLGRVDALLGDGSGAFPTIVSSAFGTPMVGLVLRDFDGDGHADIFSSFSQLGVVTLLRGDGTGAFSGASSVEIGVAPVALLAGDFDGDGRWEPMVSGVLGLDLSATLLGLDSAGQLYAQSSFRLSGHALTVGDIDGNGRSDVVARAFSVNRVTSILSGREADISLEMHATVRLKGRRRTITYEIRATNNGPEEARDARLRDALPRSLQRVAWTCVASEGGSCQASGEGDIRGTVSLPVGGTATYSVSGIVLPGTQRVVNVARVFRGSGWWDPLPASNTATSGLTLAAPRPSFRGVTRPRNGPGSSQAPPAAPCCNQPRKQ
jgi:uncharacterized repeat protein (TIGR01451 family)